LSDYVDKKEWAISNPKSIKQNTNNFTDSP
jgi:hypothetical protein